MKGYDLYLVYYENLIFMIDVGLCNTTDQQFLSDILTNIGHFIDFFLRLIQRRLTITFVSAHTMGN